MADTLTQLITKLQPLLYDNGTLFTTPTCTAAIRQALLELNIRIPQHMATTIDVVAGQYVYELTDALAGATPLTIIDVLLEDPTGKENDVSLDFDSYIEDERWFFRLHSPQSSGKLVVDFTQAHTVSGLDSATESTLPAFYDVVLLDGAAAEACYMAAAGKVEANNLDPRTAENYRNAAIRFQAAFNAEIKALNLRRGTQVSVPDTRTWDDKYHTWMQ
jgi:hypothetical protein